MKKIVVFVSALVVLLSVICGCSQDSTIMIEQSEAISTSELSNTSTPAPTQTVMSTKTTEPEVVVIIIDGSTSMYRTIKDLAEMYSQNHPNVYFEIDGRSALRGIEFCVEGKCDIAMVSRELIEEESAIEDLITTTICRQGVVLGVNVNNAVDGLTINQVGDMFSGQITNWSEVGGEQGDIRLYLVDQAYSSLFEDCFDIKIDKSVLSDVGTLSGSQGYPYTILINDPQGATFLRIRKWYENFSEQDFSEKEYKRLSIDGVAPTYENIQSGEYKQYRNFNLVTLGEPSGEVAAFIEFCTTDPEALKYLQSERLVVF